MRRAVHILFGVLVCLTILVGPAILDHIGGNRENSASVAFRNLQIAQEDCNNAVRRVARFKVSSTLFDKVVEDVSDGRYDSSTGSAETLYQAVLKKNPKFSSLRGPLVKAFKPILGCRSYISAARSQLSSTLDSYDAWTGSTTARIYGSTYPDQRLTVTIDDGAARMVHGQEALNLMRREASN
jgi:hypothetical protein